MVCHFFLNLIFLVGMARTGPNSFLSRIPAKENQNCQELCFQLTHYAAFYSWWLETTAAKALELDILIGNNSIFYDFDAGSVMGKTLHWHYMHISKQSYLYLGKQTGISSAV